MAVIIEDKKPRNVKLLVSEIEEIIRCLKSQPNDLYEFLNYGKLIKKLEKSFEK